MILVRLVTCQLMFKWCYLPLVSLKGLNTFIRWIGGTSAFSSFWRLLDSYPLDLFLLRPKTVFWKVLVRLGTANSSSNCATNNYHLIFFLCCFLRRFSCIYCWCFGKSLAFSRSWSIWLHNILLMESTSETILIPVAFHSEQFSASEGIPKDSWTDSFCLNIL